MKDTRDIVWKIRKIDKYFLQSKINVHTGLHLKLLRILAKV